MEQEFSLDRLRIEILLFLYNYLFCLIWRSEDVSYNQAIEKLENDFQIDDNFIAEENIISHFKYEFIPMKIDSHLTDFIVFDLETHNTDRARPHCISFHRLSKLAGRYKRDLTPYEFDKCKKDTITFDVDTCVSNALDFCLKLKGEERRTSLIYTIVEYNLQLHAYKGSGFDTWIILNNLPCGKHFVDIIK